AQMDVLVKNDNFYCLELHVADPTPQTRLFRIFTHKGQFTHLDLDSSSGEKEVRYINDSQDVQNLYDSLYTSMTSQSYEKVDILASSQIGSEKSKQVSSFRLSAGK